VVKELTMKAIKNIVLVLALATAPAAADTMEIHYGWDATDIRHTTSGGFDLLGVGGSRIEGVSLGRVSDMRLLPPGFEVAGYRVVHEQWTDLAGEYRLARETKYGLTEEAGDTGGGIRLLTSTGLLGYQVMVSVIEPVRVSGGKAAVLSDMVVEVDLEPAEPGLKVMRRSQVAEARVRDALNAVLGETPDRTDWEVQSPKGFVTQAPSREGSAVDCVIITPDSLAGEFERLAAWHNRMGIRSVVRSMEWVNSRYPGADGAERVRRFLQEAYAKWGTVYALLGGDPHLVPIRVIEVPGMLISAGRSDMPTDVYYMNLDGNWNADGDGNIGEYVGGNPDGVDILPDMFVGRAPVASTGEARIFVDKTMNYANGLKPGGWQETAVVLAQVLWPDSQTDGAAYAEYVIPHLPEGFTVHRLYQNYQDYPGAVEETAQNTLAYLNQGCNVLSHIGHGDELRLDLGTEFMERFQLDALDNDSMFCFVFMMNCSAADPRVESVAKAFMKNPGGGAFAVMGNSSPSFPYTGRNMQSDFYDLAFADHALGIGAASALYRPKYVSVSTSDQAWWMYLNYILNGDPVVRLWKERARPLTVLDVGSMTLSDSVYSVEVLDGGVGVSGARVVMMGDRGEYGFGITGSDGIAEVGYRPLGLGYAELSVSADGYLMYGDSVEVGGAGGRLYVSSVSVDDGVGWAGNDDGEAGWGERLGLGVGLCNGGAGSVTGVGCDIRAVAGCSLYVRVEFDDAVSDSVIHIGGGGYHPGGLEFGLGVGDRVFGRSPGVLGDESGGWFWLDASGWHVRFIGDGSSHSYSCSLSVYGELVGYVGYELEEGDELGGGGGELWFGGELGASDFIDGLDLAMGSGWDVTVHEGHADYGSVGGSEVLGWYDVEFLGGGGGDGLGVWFEASMDGDGGSWQDWFRVDVVDGEVKGERLVFEGLGGDTTGVYYGIRNTGGGGLRGVEGLVRGLSGVEVCDSVAAYGDVCGGCYSEGGQYRVRETGGAVSYEVIWRDYYGREWSDTVEVREVVAPTGLGYRLVLEDLELYWEPSESSGLSGYDVYRGDTYGGEYELVGTVEGYSRLEESGLASEESYYYYVCARDSMGNMSAPSETLEAWTGPPYLPGWPAELRGAVFSSPVVGDASHTGSNELFVGSKGLEVTGIDAGGRTLDGFPYQGQCEVWSSPALADLDGDGTLECIVGEGIGNKGRTCARVLVFNHDGSYMSPACNPLLPPGSPGWPQTVGAMIRSTPALGDLDHDGHPEIVIGTESAPGRIYVFRYDGSPYLEGSALFAQTESTIWASPCLADLDDDGSLEIIVCDLTHRVDGVMMGGNLYIWRSDGSPYFPGSDGIAASVGAPVWSSPAVGDVDGDGVPEMVAVDTWGRISVWNNDATPCTGAKAVIANTGLNTWSSPALADFDGDGTLEIVAGFGQGVGKLVLVRYNGAPYSGDNVIFEWGRSLGYSAPAVADIDADGSLEIVTCSEDGFVLGLESDGSFAPGYPIKIDGTLFSNPVIADLDGDGDQELLVPSYDSRLYCWDLAAPYSSESVPWPMFQHDPWRTGNVDFVAPSDTKPPEYSIAVFQNPLIDHVLDIFVAVSENLRTSPEVILGSSSGRVTLDSEEVPNGDRIVHAHYLTSAAVAETLFVTATDLYGNVGTAERIITYSKIVGNRLVVISGDGELAASAPAGSGCVLAILPVDGDYLKGRDDVGLDVSDAAYNVCVMGESRPISLRIKADEARDALYVFEDGWKPLEGQQTADGYVTAENAAPGIYALGAGPSGPGLKLTISAGVPTPFGETTAFVISLPRPGRLEGAVYDVSGRLVGDLYDGRAEGTVQMSWDGRNGSGEKVSSGIYFIRVRSGSDVAVSKVILVR
jgi:hypothetical protein